MSSDPTMAFDKADFFAVENGRTVRIRREGCPLPGGQGLAFDAARSPAGRSVTGGRPVAREVADYLARYPRALRGM